jgi:hypothetical protein
MVLRGEAIAVSRRPREADISLEKRVIDLLVPRDEILPLFFGSEAP